MAIRNRWPAWLDIIQGATGLALVLFMWAHLFAVSSILLGKDAMYRVSKFFEGSLFFAEPQPMLVSLVALIIFTLFMIHALLAIRKLPASYRQYRVYLQHLRGMRHEETSLWMVQVVTGLILMFFATAPERSVPMLLPTVSCPVACCPWVLSCFWQLRCMPVSGCTD